jgi:hypothetical protein
MHTSSRRPCSLAQHGLPSSLIQTFPKIYPSRSTEPEGCPDRRQAQEHVPRAGMAYRLSAEDEDNYGPSWTDTMLALFRLMVGRNVPVEITTSGAGLAGEVIDRRLRLRRTVSR